MNPNYIHTITVFNCLRAEDNPDSSKDTWGKTVIHDCYYKSVMGRVDSDKSSMMQNVYVARIPKDSRYLPYHEWAKKTEEERELYFTFSLGDIVVKGECPDQITGKSPNTATDILQKYKPDAFKVTDFSDNTSHKMSKHYRVGG